MLRRLRFALSPGWVAFHVITVVLAVTMILLGRWQLDVSDSKHFDLQNFGYALQWWAFSLFTVGMWARLLTDTRRRREEAEPVAGSQSEPAEGHAVEPEPVAYRRYVMPQSSDAPAPAADTEHAAYNDYLARLAADAGSTGAEGTIR